MARKAEPEALSVPSEDQLRLIIDKVPVMVWTATPDGSRDFINARWLEYTGLPPEAALGKSFVAMHPEDRKDFFAHWEEAMEAGMPMEREIRLRRGDGKYFWTLHRIVPLRDGSENVVKWLATITDIDALKRAGQTLREREAYLAEAQRLSQTGSWAWTPATGDIRYWSEECYRVLGFDPRSPLPRFEDFIQRLHPEDRALIRDRFERAVRDKASFEFDYRILHPSRGTRDIRAVGHAVLSKSGDLVEFVGTVMDVTHRKRAEEELQQLVDFVPQLIVVMRPDGKWIQANRGVREYTGLTLEEYRSKDVMGRVIHPDDAPGMRAARERAFFGKDPFEFEARMLGKDGAYRWFLFRYSPFMEQGCVTKWYGTATEIERRKQTEERVRRDNVRLEERTRIAQELHDTLLQSFLSASMQLSVALDGVEEDSPVRPRLDRVLQVMNEGIEEGRNTIQALRSTDARSPDLVVALSAVRQELAVQPDVDFRVNVAGRPKPLESPIRHEIYRIGREALVNAFCHSRANRVELDVDFGDSELHIRIHDNGCGIDAQVLNAGRQGHWGLAGMRERAKKVGGSLKISSGPTGGTDVQLSIPNEIAFQPPPQFPTPA